MFSGDPNRPNPSPLPGAPIRLYSIKGYSQRTNNVIYCPPLIKSPKDQIPSAVVYFGGDVQDVPENMESNRDTKSYMKYNLENTAILLRESFPKSHIIVVLPARMEYTTFSCFDNFVRGNCAGIPDHTPMHYALQHLEELLSNITKKLTKLMSETELITRLTKLTSGRSMSNTQSVSQGTHQQNNIEHTQEMDIDILQVQDTVTVDSTMFTCKDDSNCTPHVQISNDLTPELMQTGEMPAATMSSNNSVSAGQNDVLWWRETLNLDKANLALVGFSKGCVVLNQFIYEFHYLKTLTPDDSTMMRLVSRIKDMYWLDGGHGGGKNTWITSRSLLETLCRLSINIHVHVTPYQVQDDHRPWIRKEEKAFTDLLKRLGAPLTRHLHSSDINVSNLFTHFEVLHGFKKYHLQILAHQQQMQQQQQQQQQQQFQQAQTNNVEVAENNKNNSSSGEESEADK